MSDTQPTRSFFAAAQLQAPADIPQLHALFHQIGTRIQEATNDGRTYTVEVRTVVNIVEPLETKTREYVSPRSIRA